MIETGGVRPGRLALAVGGVAAAVAVVWGLTQVPIAQETRDRDDEETASIDEDEEPVRPERTTTTRRAITTTISTANRAATGAADTTSTTEEIGPIVGEETGLLAVFFSYESQGYQVVDLDTGVRRDIRGRQDDPIGVIGSSIVINGTNGPVVLDLSDPEPERERLDIDQAWAHVITVHDDRIWVVDEGEDSTLVAYDRDGSRVAEVEVPVPWWWEWQRTGPVVRPNQFFYDPAGGLYRYGADRAIERLVEAAPVALGEQIGLVRTCDAGFDCGHVWIDLETGSALDLPVPSSLADEANSVILGSDRWLLHTEWSVGQSTLIEIATGEARRQVFADQGWYYAGAGLGPVSDDGRWLIDTIAGQHVVVDLESDEIHELGLSGSYGVTGFFAQADG